MITGTTYQSILGGVIVQERKTRNLSQGELAARLGISQSAWSRVEQGLSNLSIEQLVKVANALKTYPHILIQKADRTKMQLEINKIPVTESKLNDEGWLLLGAAALAAIILAANK